MEIRSSTVFVVCAVRHESTDGEEARTINSSVAWISVAFNLFLWYFVTVITATIGRGRSYGRCFQFHLQEKEVSVAPWAILVLIDEGSWLIAPL